MSDLRARILAASDIEKETVEVQEWGVTVEVRGLSAGAQARILKASTANGEQDPEKLIPALLIATVFDPETGQRVFSDLDRDALNEKGARAIGKLAEVALRVAGLSGGDAEKNSEATPASATE